MGLGRIAIVCMILIVLLPSAFSAREGRMKLLAVSDMKNGMSGSVADLLLEIPDGEGRVFLETFPLTKVDTQISMRFAKQIACKQLDTDCSGMDFIYTVRSGSGIVGGPSAGAAASLLTASLILDVPLRKDVSITGTINSGGIIGAVGGIREKIEAASKANITKVLIPAGERFQDVEFLKEEMKPAVVNKGLPNNTNSTQNSTKHSLDLILYGQELGTEIVEVGTFAEALEEMSGFRLPKFNVSIQLNQEYDQVMREVAQDLCQRSRELEKNISLYVQNNTKVKEEYNISVNHMNRAEGLLNSSDFYSAASFCFRSNVVKSAIDHLSINRTRKDSLRELRRFEREINKLHEHLSNLSIDTITDLQTFIIVKDRLYEAEDHLKLSKAQIKNKNASVPHADIALVGERVRSAQSWARFFGMQGKRFAINEQNLKDSCLAKIREAEERYQYLSLLMPKQVGHIGKQIQHVYTLYREERYPSCIFEASKAKSAANVVLSVIGYNKDQIEEIRKNKLQAAENVIFESQEGGTFPLAGYSYYRYSQVLEDETYSSLLYAEYALELSNLDMYFPQKGYLKISIDWDAIMLFLLGLFIGIFVMEFVKKGRV